MLQVQSVIGSLENLVQPPLWSLDSPCSPTSSQESIAERQVARAAGAVGEDGTFMREGTLVVLRFPFPSPSKGEFPHLTPPPKPGSNVALAEELVVKNDY